MSLTSVDLPEPETPVTATKQPSGNAHVDVAQVVLARADHGELAALGRAAAGWPGSAIARGRTGRRRSASPAVEQARATVPESTIWPPCSPAPGPMSTTQSARADGVLVVLDDDQRVAEVAQPDQRLDQPVVVALVQPDRRLVEDVEHADQAGPDLGGQPDPLRLAAGQRAGRAGRATGSRARRRAGSRAAR